MIRVVVTGAGGVLGWHARVRMHGQDSAARARGERPPFDVIALDHTAFDDDAALAAALAGADAVLHFAGVAHGPEAALEAANPAIARRLARACAAAGRDPHIVYANTSQAGSDTAHGRSKRLAGEILSGAVSCYTELVLPHLFGEGARPFHNNLAATLIHRIHAGDPAEETPGDDVRLLHAGAAAELAIAAIHEGTTGRIAPPARQIPVADLYARLEAFHRAYRAGTVPDLTDPFDRDLFNSYRAAGYPGTWPRQSEITADARGARFEAARGETGGQTCVSTTRPGVTRGDHFHLRKVERVLVLRGEAVIRIRKVLGGDVWEYRVSGEQPSILDMPTLHSHAIENIGHGELLTMCWSNEPDDPADPDTYADRVLQ